MASVASDARTLGRLSFWVPRERMSEFETLCERKLVPILKKHGLAESSEQGRVTLDSVFRRLFELQSPAEIATKELVLQKDSEWQKTLQDVKKACVPEQPDRLMRWSFGVYRAPCGPGRTVAAGAGIRQGAWQSFSVLDGLPHPRITDVLEDREGHMWLASAQGLSRYDGQTFTTFTREDGLASDYVGHMLEDREGNLWFGTERGVSVYDGRLFTTFTVEDGLAWNWVSSMVQDQNGRLWIAGVGGVSQYDGQTFTSLTTEDGLAQDDIHSMLADREGNLWFGTHGRGVTRYDGQAFATFTTDHGLAHDRVNCILEDRDGLLWFGTGSYEDPHSGGVTRFDGREFVTFSESHGLAHNCVWDILEDREGFLWFGTNNGASRYDGQSFRTYAVEDGLAGNCPWTLFEDSQGCVWFGTLQGGVSRYAGVEFTTFTTRDGLLAHEGGLLVDRHGSLWYGSCRYDRGRFTSVDALAGIVAIVLLEDRAGNLWFLNHKGGVSRYDGEHLVTFTADDGLAHNNVDLVMEDRSGTLWFGCHAGGGVEGGLSRYDGESFDTFTTEDGLASNRVRWILEDRYGTLWIATDNGVSVYDGEQFRSVTTLDGLPHNRVHSILEDRAGTLWFGTAGGLSRYDGERFVTFTTEDGLAHNEVHWITEDRDGHLLFVMAGAGVGRYDGFVFQHLCRRDGLTHDSVGKILQDDSRDIWIVTPGGLNRYRAHHVPPAVRITQIIADRRYDSASEIRIPTSQKSVVFEFKGDSRTTRPEGFVYVYRLEGLDADWRKTRAPRVSYEELALGDYTFQVKAVDRDLNYSEPAAVSVTVAPDPYVEALTEALGRSGSRDQFVGTSAALKRVQAQLTEVAPTDLTVLIYGETGTGKGLAARTIHGMSSRKTGPLVQVSCGAIPATLVESELFGHERGAFTGAVSRKLGKVELAAGGTLFLDEIGDLAPEAQAKLLRVLEERAFERVGGTRTLETDARVVAATNRNLEQMVAAGQFREDLYFRLQVFCVQLPPLRERREDIPLLATYFMESMAAHLDKTVTGLCSPALAVLHAYEWPGNVRELEHVIKRAVVVCPGPEIRVEDIALGSARTDSAATATGVTLEEHERRYVRQVLEETGWVIGGSGGAAAILGIPPSTLRSRMKRLGIQRS